MSSSSKNADALALLLGVGIVIAVPVVLITILTSIAMGLQQLVIYLYENLQPLKTSADSLAVKLRLEECACSHFSVDLCHNDITELIDTIDAIFTEWTAFLKTTGGFVQFVENSKEECSSAESKLKVLSKLVESGYKVTMGKIETNRLIHKTTDLMTKISLKIKSVLELRHSFRLSCAFSDEDQYLLVSETDDEIHKLYRCIFKFRTIVAQGADGRIAKLETSLEDEIRSQISPSNMTPEIESCILEMTEIVNATSPGARETK